MTAPHAMEGQVLAGKYRVERVLGQGGMGVVLAAKHIHLEELVAVKLMLAEAAFSTEAVARFLREARAAAKLQSAHVARVSDVGTLDDGRPYMVMEYLDGSDLSQVLAASGPLQFGDAVDYVLQAAEALAEAHSIGIIHRDLKPSNLFLTRRRDRTPHVKVLDFGISKVSGSSLSGSDNAMTKTSAMMGSPLYMSPEQMTSVRDVDARSDIWALGIILYELLTGAPPFMGETLPQVCGLVLQSEPTPLSARRPDVPPELSAVVMQCLAKNPDQRFQNIAGLAVALQGLAGRYGRASVERILLLTGGEQSAPSAKPQVVPAPLVATQTVIPGTHAAWGETRPPDAVPKRSSAGIVAGLVLVPLLAAGAWWAFGAHAKPVAGPEGSVTVVTGAEPAPSAPASVLAEVPSAPAPVPVEIASTPAPEAAPALPQPDAKPVANNRRPLPSHPPATPPRASAVGAPPTPPATPSARKPNCDPNFYLDAQGEKHFKKECF